MTSKNTPWGSKDLTAPDLIQIVWRRKITVLIFALIGLLLGSVALSFKSSKFEALGLLQIKAEKLVATGGIPAIVSNNASTEDLYFAREEIVSTTALTHVVDSLGLQDDPEFNSYINPGLLERMLRPEGTPEEIRAGVLRNLKSAIELETPDDSALIEIKVRSGRAEKAAQIASLLTERYILKNAKGLLERAMFASPDTADTALQTELVRARLARLRGVMDDLEYPQDGATQKDFEAFLQNLRETSDLALSSYGLVLSNLDVQLGESSANQKAGIPIGLQKLFASLVSPITTPTEPLASKTALIAVVALFLGLIAGLLFVLMRAFARPTVHVADDLSRQFDLDIWGTLEPISSLHKTSVTEIEPYRDLRSTILLKKPTDTSQVILLTSATPKTSVTDHALCLAKSYQAIEKSVLVIDTDMRESPLAKQYSDSAKGNLTTFLKTGADIKDVTIDIEGVALLLGGQGQNDTVEQFSSGSFAAALATLRAQTDIIILAGPPASEFSDAAVLQPLSDVSLIGVHFDQTQLHDIQTSVSRLQLSSPEHLGFYAIKA